jgi:hypothetical protein
MQNKTLKLLIALILLLLCAEISFAFPDLDQKFNGEIPSKVLSHRSILTHSFLLALLSYWATFWRKQLLPRLYGFVVGIATAVHLSFDLFPKKWVGYSLIHIPLIGRTSPEFSKLWIGLSIIISLYVVFLCIRNSTDVVIVLACLVLLFGFYTITEDQRATSPALVLSAATTVTLILPSNAHGTWQQLYKKRFHHRRAA